jgi:hypothetical protein
MHFARSFCLLLAPVVMAACTAVAPAPSGSSGIVVGPNEMRVCGQGKVIFPAGLYHAQLVTARGTYYLAPERLRTVGVLIGQSELGGIYIANTAGNPQAAWFGDPNEVTESKPTTLFSAIGVRAPKLWPYDPAIPFKVKK